ncbi:bifunctional demethylmenaquinone methyltransferase/2-methoxy-6-polyprenyl-1,4-benzoquinol methylase UbiE [Elizabethkingia anophelis]|uniref:bifunctional demethylmenaquinone methyltransferase/2-methoxy-6-polyprenyl-1,4-benzoquinol methylase UbiE n=1 Tax=Elizabethkingia anophelis TaxID=1117645 RepID=UPI000B35D679|nr:bifunctional demethylmenaquinone methyltransferase/2-methoxy-6-polyprenyl-1,4-benzoquinol methylase UbiE [Elizabethkingia anophelis]MCT3698036.1 bifunctional demethylmenaquinone methyltransferase/2-methoxy-6-polyprenyl-1,4-benzoquinol methylase UbiE [Elizabethkingia anophelis]MCT4121995.1 bifunctional demethylmenaquinone methyltransferase/2-methoxy-6-polyprenyl-1,4-benzoquinol methylase UbiE [Elizabethkingia anophelis]MCT4324880.1 bifunctional demethylmenaquinone methyltransferase/2-methoxy-6
MEHNTITPYNSEQSKKNQVEEMFDNIAPKYDLLNHVLSMKIDVTWRNKLVKWLKIDTPNRILDVATGTGDLALTIQKGTSADVVGYDLSQQMLNVGIEKVKRAGLQDKIQMIKGDAEHMPFKDNEFDAITAAFGVRNFENLEKGLAEMKRVVKTNGNVFILEFSKVEGFLGPFYMFYFKNILPNIGKLISKDSRAYTYLPDSVNAFPYGEKMKNILLNLGFSKVEYKKLTFGIATIYKATK